MGFDAKLRVAKNIELKNSHFSVTSGKLSFINNVKWCHLLKIPKIISGDLNNS